MEGGSEAVGKRRVRLSLAVVVVTWGEKGGGGKRGCGKRRVRLSLVVGKGLEEGRGVREKRVRLSLVVVRGWRG